MAGCYWTRGIRGVHLAFWEVYDTMAFETEEPEYKSPKSQSKNLLPVSDVSNLARPDEPSFQDLRRLSFALRRVKQRGSSPKFNNNQLTIHDSDFRRVTYESYGLLRA